MNIHTERLLLVPLGPQYLLSTHEYASDLDNTKYMVHLPNADIEETKTFLDRAQAEWQTSNPQFYEFAILLDDIHIGAVDIYISENNSEGELGWIISKKYWGYGYATEAARELISFAKHEWKISKFIAHCDSENVSSYNVMEKLGMSIANKTKGRKNKYSNDDREDLMYLLEIE
ncbi:MAG: acetyltransferase, family [Herbinix sp.]|jgi:RimJ/RimL family protein N-acetyltransferase|nr:acetyltransferase, family [Herbinix sp.]